MDVRLPLLAICAVLLRSPRYAQSNDEISSLRNEVSKGTVLTYTQRYTDDQKEEVIYRGTLFLQISSVSLDACELKLAVRVQDRYTGQTVKQHAFSSKTTELGLKVQTFSYTYLLKLKDFQEMNAAVLDSRPMQIQSHTGYACEEAPLCHITWLDVKVPRALIEESRQTDGFVDVNQMVKEMTIPMSSQQAAQDSASSLRAIVAGCSQPRGKG